VVVVAASGNSDKDDPPLLEDNIEFPAIHEHRHGGRRRGCGWQLVLGAGRTHPRGWHPPHVRSASGPKQWVVAPAVEVRSLFYRGGQWVKFSDPAFLQLRGPEHCHAGAAPGFGNCTGTSMAAPHVSAIAALVKSADPLMSAAGVRDVIMRSGDAPSPLRLSWVTESRAPEGRRGGPWRRRHQEPDHPLSSLLRRTFPTGNFNHVYTVVPQVAMGRSKGNCRRKPRGIATYHSIGNTVPGYASYPRGCSDCVTQPRSQSPRSSRRM